MLFLLSAEFSFLNTFFKKSIKNAINLSNSLDPDHDRHFVGPDQGPNCLQKLSTDEKIVITGRKMV